MTVVFTCTLCRKEFRVDAKKTSETNPNLQLGDMRRHLYLEPDTSLSIFVGGISQQEFNRSHVCQSCAIALGKALTAAIKTLDPTEAK